MIADGSPDYNSWRSLILEIVTAIPEDINTISLAYDSFLSIFPLCHWHLEKYAFQKAKLCGPQEAVNIYERGVETAMFSVGFWVDYFMFGTTCFEPEEVRRKEISLVVKDLLDSSDKSLKSKALDRYISIGDQFYQEARKMDEKIMCFETKIVRRYFHATPLEENQLSNWHVYLDFIETQDNLDTAVKLYERCLIPCANYPEFWMRYVEFLESKGGREMAISALNRATQTFLKDVAQIHLFSARFKERIGDINGARAALILCDTKIDSNFIDNIVTLANLERRLGNNEAASATYEKALKKAREAQKLHVLPTLYSQFARLTFLITGSAAVARDVLIEGVRQVPRCRFLLEELIKFAMTHEGERQVHIIETVITDAISNGLDEYGVLNAKDREQISCLFLEFVNLCGTTHDVRKAWNHLVKDQTRKVLPQRDQNENAEETVEVLSTKAVVLSDEDAVCHNLSNQSIEKPTKMDISDEIANKQQSNGNSLSPHESIHEAGKSTETSEPIEASPAANLDHPVSLDKISLKSPEKEPPFHSEPTKIHRDQEQPSQPGAVEENKETSGTVSAISYPQQEQQSMAMNQMMQYYYQQQQLYQQQQQQQQMYQQHPYYQMQQPYYTNQQTNQQPTHQHQQNPQSQDIAYQLAYQQNVTQGQQQQQQQQHMLWQQYQQYPGYQYQQYPNEGPIQNQHQIVISKEIPAENVSRFSFFF
ncbi:hypothetical protein MIMGU_mgv1a002156mg [Erythranthe guttata]|uniref:Suppressor of forked domain-containing protein n=1 Tax=Erythranthe guttata TaxID=4155 RepID=A0A022RTE3_ERYGU|nr:hypothetical protein MIMGU_mgv1a002156mg [Erythranthe guttata]